MGLKRVLICESRAKKGRVVLDPVGITRPISLTPPSTLTFRPLPQRPSHLPRRKGKDRTSHRIMSRTRRKDPLGWTWG